jgi:hypothetical protein
VLICVIALIPTDARNIPAIWDDLSIGYNAPIGKPF